MKAKSIFLISFHLDLNLVFVYSTCIEFPSNAGYSDPFGGSLLAMQRWSKANPEENWKLEFHRLFLGVQTLVLEVHSDVIVEAVLL